MLFLGGGNLRPQNGLRKLKFLNALEIRDDKLLDFNQNGNFFKNYEFIGTTHLFIGLVKN